MLFNKEESRKRKMKIIRLYLQSIAMLFGYWWMTHSTAVNQLLEKGNRLGDRFEFSIYTIVGILKYGLLTAGSFMLLLLTLFVLLELKKSTSSKHKA